MSSTPKIFDAKCMRLKSLFILFLLPFIAFPAFAAKPTPTPTPVNKSVCLDPGHGGTDSGAINQDLQEKNINLLVGLALRDRLTSDGYTIFMTRTTNITLSNSDRYTYCNSTGAAFVV